MAKITVSLTELGSLREAPRKNPHPGSIHLSGGEFLAATGLPQSVQAAGTDPHRLDLNKRLLPSALEAGKSKIKAPDDWVSGENPLPGSQAAVFPLSSHRAGGDKTVLWGLF